MFFSEVDYTKELCVVDGAMTHYLHKREKSFLQLLLCWALNAVWHKIQSLSPHCSLFFIVPSKNVPLLFGVFHKCVKTEFQNTPSFKSVMTGACTKYQNFFLRFLHVYCTEATYMFSILNRKMANFSTLSFSDWFYFATSLGCVLTIMLGIKTEFQNTNYNDRRLHKISKFISAISLCLQHRRNLHAFNSV